MMSLLQKKLLLTALPLGILTACQNALPPPPATPRDAVVDVIHGEKIADPYRWLEGSAAPEFNGTDAEKTALDAKVRAWSESQNARTRAYLDNIPGREKLEAKLQKLFRTDSLGTPTIRGNYEFFTRRRGTESNSVLYVRDGKNGTERELLNVNKLYPDGRTTLSWTHISHDGKLVGFALFKSGDERTTLRILETATGEWLEDIIPGKVSSMSWTPDGKGFIYRCLGNIENPYSGQIKYHEVGTPLTLDKLIFSQHTEGPLAHTYGPDAHLDRTGKWLILSYATGTSTNDLWVCDFQHWNDTAELKKITINEGSPHPYNGAIHNGALYVHTTDGAEKGQLYKIPLEKPARENWEKIIPENDTAVLAGFSIAKNFLAITWNKDALQHIEIRDLNGKFLYEVPLPGIGTAGISTDSERDDGYLRFSSYNIPPSTYHLDLKTKERSLYFRPDYAVDSDALIVKQEFYPSKDGTKIPLFIVHKKDIPRNGTAPTLLYGYGGFSIAMTPGFTGGVIPWLDAGGVFAVACLRGGDEYGEPWHQAGMLGKKQNVFDDFIAAAEFLIREKYTTPAHLGIRGGSNGGLLTGATLVQRPDLFGAVNIGVPLLDMLRYQNFLMARYWIPEYGTAENGTDFQWLKKYSPYQNIKPGEKYPAVLLEAGENDARVHPLHARKMAARLQNDTAGDPQKQPILLWVDFDSGHGSGKSFEMQVRDTADIYLFFAKQLGLEF